MIWGDFQSVIQLATAINLAYYSVPEIRLPYIAKIDAEFARVAELKSGKAAFVWDIKHAFSIREARNETGDPNIGMWEEQVRDKWQRVVMDATGYVNPNNWEVWLNAILLLISLAGVFALIGSAYYFKSQANLLVSVTAIVVGYGPVSVLSALGIFNSARFRRRLAEATSLRQELEELAELQAEPEWRKKMQADIKWLSEAAKL